MHFRPLCRVQTCDATITKKNLCSLPETLNNKLRSRCEMLSENSVWQTSTDTPMPQSSAESLEQVRKQLEVSVPRYELGEWKYEYHMSSFPTTILNLLFTEAEHKGKTRNFRMYIGPGSDGSSAEKLSLDLKFNPWDTAITFRPEWRSVGKTGFMQYDPFETWYTCQSDVWHDDVKRFSSRPICCVIVVHPYPLAQEDTTLLTDSAFISCAKICIDDSRFSSDLHKDKRVTLKSSECVSIHAHGPQWLVLRGAKRLTVLFLTDGP